MDKEYYESLDKRTKEYNNKLKKCGLFDIEKITKWNIEKELEYHILMKKIEKEINTWNWYDSSLFTMYIDESMSMKKIFNETGISVTSVFKTIKKCKKNIINKFTENYKNFADGNYETIKQDTQTNKLFIDLFNCCLLYTSPSPRDS